MNVLQPTKWAAIILLLISTQVFAQMSNEKKTFSNPVIYSDVPDVDVIRVDDTFYMISTTMHLMPGAPIMRSKDLVNWEIISYLYDEIKDSPFYDLEGGMYIQLVNGPLPFVTTMGNIMCFLQQISLENHIYIRRLIQQVSGKDYL